MEFTQKKVYKKDKVYETYFIDNKQVDQYVYESLDNDAFEKHIKNMKLKKQESNIDIKKIQSEPIINQVENIEDFNDIIVDIVNYIKISKVSDAVERIVTALDDVADQSYTNGYINAFITMKDNLDMTINKIIKKTYKKLQ